MDVIKFFRETQDKNREVEGGRPSFPRMTSYEARRCVEDVLNHALQTVVKLEKLHQQQTACSNQVAYLPPTSKVSSTSSGEKKPVLGVCKEATFWLNRVKSKIAPTYFHLPVADNKLIAQVPTLTQTPCDTRQKFILPKLKH